MRIHQKFNATPFNTAFSPCLDENGAGCVVAVLKATFRFSDAGETSVTDGPEMVPVFERDVFHGDPQKSSLRYPSDMVPKRYGTDIILNGQAYGFGQCRVLAGFHVGDLAKQVVVTGKRHWTGLFGSPKPSSPAPFDRVPLRYEHAYGGDALDNKGVGQVYAYNPVGIGYALTSSKHSPIPHLEYQRQSIRSTRDRPMPAATGPIPPSWKQRLQYAGTWDESWLRTRNPLFPADFDTRFYNAVPQDQVHEPKLKGGEKILLLNVHPRQQQIQLQVPTLSLSVTFNVKERSEVVPMVMDQLLLEPDRDRLALTFRSSLFIGEDWQYLKSVHFEKEG